MTEGTLLLGEGQHNGADPATVAGVSERTVLGPTGSGRVGSHPRTVHSPQAAFHWHPAHPKSGITGLDTSSCSSAEPKGERATVGLWQEGRALKLF